MANRASLLFQELSRTELSAVIQAHFPHAEVIDYSLCDGGLFNTTYRVELLEKNHFLVILRLGPVHREVLMGYEHDMMKTEAHISSLMHQHGIPTSEVLIVNCKRDLVDRDYMITRYIEGIAFSGAQMDSAARFAIEKECGKYLRRMHEIKAPGFGRATDVLFGKGYPDFFTSLFAEFDDLCRKSSVDGFFTKEECDEICSAIMRHKEVLVKCNSPVLCHGDMWSGNVLVAREKSCVSKTDGKYSLAAIIDVDRAYFGDCDFDLGNPWILSDAFLEGYGITR